MPGVVMIGAPYRSLRLATPCRSSRVRSARLGSALIAGEQARRNARRN